MNNSKNKYGGNVLSRPTYDEFVKEVKNISTCCAFFNGQGYVKITEEIREKIKNGDLVITEYQWFPLGEVIYLSAKSQNN